MEKLGLHCGPEPAGHADRVGDEEPKQKGEDDVFDAQVTQAVAYYTVNVVSQST
jgi:hypothetical protein